MFLSCLRTKVPSLYVLRRIIVLSTLHSDVVGVKKLAEQTCRRRAPMRTVALLISVGSQSICHRANVDLELPVDQETETTAGNA